MKLTTVSEYLESIADGPLSQPDARTCQATCIAAVMGLDVSIAQVRADLLQIGEAGNPAVMAEYLTAHFGDRYSLDMTASIDDMRSWINDGSVLITHGWMTEEGHVICLDGVSEKGLRVMDPWEEFHAFEWDYIAEVSAFQGVYSDELIYAACVIGESRSDSHRIYLEDGAIDRAKGGAWIHRIRSGVASC